ncbi:MAG: hypothetical protein RBT46_09240 [Weeksellaceae bacterium]|nr:hypothetical protein [Weeksellaceae bacterium]
MKKLLHITLLLFIPFTFISCNMDDDDDDDEGGNINTDLIVGAWEWYEFGFLGGESYSYVGDCTTKKDFVEFKSNGVAEYTDYDPHCQADSYQFDYEIDGNTLIGYEFDESWEAEIDELTSSTLKLIFVDEGDEEEDEPESFYYVLKKK